MPKPREKAGILSAFSADIRAKLRENSRNTKPITCRGREWELLRSLTFELDFSSKPHYNKRKVPAFYGKRNTGGKRDFYEGLPQMRQALFRRRE